MSTVIYTVDYKSLSYLIYNLIFEPKTAGLFTLRGCGSQTHSFI